MDRRILTGMRTTGRLHLGHYVGALTSWIELQNEYECFFLLADRQALTTHFDQPEILQESVRQVVIDWLSVGLNPNKSNFVLQSRVPYYPELAAYLSYFVDIAELKRNPTLKAESGKKSFEKLITGFAYYPVDQCADILLLSPVPISGAALLVPVGADQEAHIELSKYVARRFNRQYGKTFVEPIAKIGDIGRLVDLRTTGSKMSKSAGDPINLSDPAEIVAGKIKQGVTDPAKIRRGDSGNPDICPVFKYHEAFRPDGVEETRAGCMSGQLGCVECKLNLAVALNSMLEPFRERRTIVEKQPEAISNAISKGTRKAIKVGKQTIERVRQHMQLHYPKLKLKI